MFKALGGLNLEPKWMWQGKGHSFPWVDACPYPEPKLPPPNTQS